MANVELLDSLLVKSKCKQSLSSASSSSSCASSSSCSTSNCPKEEESCCKCPPQLECCTPQYLRLSKLSTAYLLSMMGTVIDTEFLAVDRTGEDSEFLDASSNTRIAHRFVWSARYLSMEQCKEDQVWGWEVNLNTGDLRLLQDIEHATMNTTRGELLNTPVEDLSLNQRKALKMLNNLYKMSEHAARCLTYPRTEGVMVEATDKCGQKWLLLVNRASGRDNGNILNDTGRLVVVGAKL